MDKWHQSQRGYFAGQLYERMKEDPKIVIVTADLGYGMLNKIKDELPNQFINVGASEQTALGVAVGLALEGYKPFVYTITSFFLRAAETISLYLEHEKIPVRLVGGGIDNQYLHDGYSHYGYKSQEFLKSMKFVEGWPKEKEEVPDIVDYMVDNDVPSVIFLHR